MDEKIEIQEQQFCVDLRAYNAMIENRDMWKEMAVMYEEYGHELRIEIVKALNELRTTSEILGTPDFTPVGNAIDILERAIKPK